MATEKRMIIVDVFKKNLCHYCNTYMSDEPCEPGECWVHDVIAQTDTVDAVEVVRCNGCKKRDTNLCPLYHCVSPMITSMDDDFCSHGERKDNG